MIKLNTLLNFLTVTAVILTAAGFTSAALDGPSVGGSDSIAIWSMDTTETVGSYTAVPDDDGQANNPLKLLDGSLTTGNQGVWGEALVCDQNTSSGAKYTQSWTITMPTEQLGIDLWFNAATDMDVDNPHYLIEGGSYRLFANKPGDTLTFIAYDSDGGNARLDIGMKKGEWMHVTAEFINGELSLVLHNADGTVYDSDSLTHTVSTLKTTSNAVYVGSFGNARQFKGLIDEVDIRSGEIPGPPEAPFTDTPAGTFGLYHFDEVDANDITPDDDSNDPNRDLDLELIGGASIVDSGRPDFNNCLQLNGFGQYAECVVSPPYETTRDYFQVETWININPNIHAGGANPYWIIGHNDMFSLWINTGATSADPIGAQFRVMTNGTVKKIGGTIQPADQWQHLKGVFDNGHLTLYCNGIEIASGDATGDTADPSTQPYYVGADGGSRRYFYGMIDELRISGNTDFECGDFGYPEADFNKDCYVDELDLEVLVQDWLECTMESDPDCQSQL